MTRSADLTVHLVSTLLRDDFLELLERMPDSFFALDEPAKRPSMARRGRARTGAAWRGLDR